MKFLTVVVFSVICLCVCATGITFSSPVAAAQEEWNIEAEISNTQKELRKKREQHRLTEAKKRKIELELKPLQQEMVALADEIRKTEIHLSGLEEKMEILKREQRQKQESLQQRQGELSVSIKAMLRLSRIPPEAVIAVPEDLRTSLRTARTLGVLTEELQQEADSLAQQLQELHALKNKIAASHKKLSAAKKEMEKRQREMDAKYEKRKKMQQQLLADSREFAREISSLSRKSRNMSDLVNAVARKWKSRHNGIQDDNVAATVAASPKSKANNAAESKVKARIGKNKFAASKGKIRLPVAGKISSFPDGKGEDGKQYPAVAIATRPGAQVVAPFAGEVVFAGDFLDYGLMVIIRHSQSYHTLLAGMDRVDCVTGQKLVTGEPVGSMGKDGEEELYVEIRKNNKPVDPKRWFAQN